jgi:hypothetical protein
MILTTITAGSIDPLRVWMERAQQRADDLLEAFPTPNPSPADALLH